MPNAKKRAHRMKGAGRLTRKIGSAKKHFFIPSILAQANVERRSMPVVYYKKNGQSRRPEK